MTTQPTERDESVTAFEAAKRAYGGVLPPRYYAYDEVETLQHIAPRLLPGARVLDIGSGKRPILLPSDRPAGTHYTGLDLDGRELALAPPGSYNEIVVIDATTFVPALANQFDVVLCRWLLEHIRPVDVALETFRSYLCPGGRFVAHVAGRNSVAAMANRLLGRRVGSFALARLTYRTPDTIFPALYDRCKYHSFKEMGVGWSRWDVLPVYENARHFEFSRALQAIYVAYEQTLVRRDVRHLATAYILLGQA